jgi:hypothetical protein
VRQAGAGWVSREGTWSIRACAANVPIASCVVLVLCECCLAVWCSAVWCGDVNHTMPGEYCPQGSVSLVWLELLELMKGRSGVALCLTQFSSSSISILASVSSRHAAWAVTHQHTLEWVCAYAALLPAKLGMWDKRFHLAQVEHLCGVWSLMGVRMWVCCMCCCAHSGCLGA